MTSPELVKWACTHGIVADGVAAAAVAEGGRGLVATQDLAPGDCILRVPQRLLMSVHSARQDPTVAAALARLGSGSSTLSSEQLLAIHLLHQLSRGPASFWHAYLQSLPRSYTTAACFREQDVALLQAPHAMAAAQAAADAVAAAWRGALPLLRELGLQGKWSSRQAYAWAAATLSSRTMYLPDDPAGCLTPLGDFANFAPPPPPYEPTLPARMGYDDGQAGCDRDGTRAAELQQQRQQQRRQQQRRQGSEDIAGDGTLDAESGEYRLYSRRRYSAGQQVMLCYGRHTNLELLVHYGFVLPPGANPHDVALLPLHVLPPALLQQLEACGATSSSEAYVFESGAPSWALLRAARLAGASVEERRQGAHLVLDDRPISEASERAAMHSLRDACLAALASFPTSAAEDEAVLQGPQPDGQLSECGRVAVQWRLGQKMALQRGVQLAEHVLALLDQRQWQGGQQAAGQSVAAGLAALVRRPKLT